MSASAFGVDHGEVYKADREQAEGYRRKANTLGALGGTAAALGAGSGAVGLAEHKGKDPMGFTMRPHYKLKPMATAHRARILQISTDAHKLQAKGAAGVAAASLGLAAAYKHKQKKALAKRRTPTDTALDTGSAATGAAAIGGGGFMAGKLGMDTAAHANHWYTDTHNLRSAKKGKLRLGVKEQKYIKGTRAVHARVAGVKGAGTLAGVGVAGLGAKSIYDAAKKQR